MKPRRLILRNFQSPGDIVMLTAAVRDLKKKLGDGVLIDVRTSCPALWENNPHLTPLDELDPAVEVIDCHYPLIHESNELPYHFIHAFHQFLSARLGVAFAPTEFRGDIHLTREEKGWMSQVEECTGSGLPFWIVVAGGKTDFTAKWWAPERWQAVVDRFAGRILFVQVGELGPGHEHPPLRGVLDLRGKTDLRQLVRLVYHADGVLCGVTLAMHLAAAVPVRHHGTLENGRWQPAERPCVVVAGAREPAQWEAYPHHRFLHHNGALPCAPRGGCWKSRVFPLGDGDEKDGSLCEDVVELASGRRMSGAAWTEELCSVRSMSGSAGFSARRADATTGSAGFSAHRADATTGSAGFSAHRADATTGSAGFSARRADATGYLPRCLELIAPERVVEAVEGYLAGGVGRELTTHEETVCRRALPRLGWIGRVRVAVLAGADPPEPWRARVGRVVDPAVWRARAGPKVRDRTFALVSDRGYFPGLKAALNSILAYHGPRMNAVVYQRGFEGEELAWLGRHPLAPEVREVDDLPHPCPGMWEAKQQVFAHLLRRFRTVFLLDADVVLTSSMDDVFALAEQGRIVGGADGGVLEFGPEAAVYGPHVPGRRVAHLNTGAVCLEPARHWTLATLWEGSARYADYSPHGGHPLRLPGHGDQGLFNALIAHLGLEDDVHLFPHRIWHECAADCSMRIDDAEHDGRLRVLNEDIAEPQRLLHATMGKWWRHAGAEQLEDYGDKLDCYRHFGAMCA